MHLRKLTLTVGLIGTMFSTWAFGLGLGEITLKSTLNQPLDAEIKLLQVRNLSEEEILVELAPAVDFQRFGIERLYFLQSLKFDVQLDHPSGPLVRIRTDEPVREPYLVFLIQAQSAGGGRLLREYTLLMDLPVFAATPSAPVQAPARQIEAPHSEPAPAIRPQTTAPTTSRPIQREGEPPRAQPAPGRSVAAQPSGPIDSADGYMVQANDTLWEIARSVRPSGLSMQQSMLALQNANPGAFIDGNINLLKRGQVLRIPENDEWQVLDQQAAVREVALQNNEWRGRMESGSGAELAATASRPTRQRGTEAPRGQLTLSAPGDADRASETSGAGDSAARGEALENELAIASEELDAARRENTELNSRVGELEEQIATMERLLDVSSAELRALQLAAEQSRSAEPETVAAEVEESTSSAEEETVAEAELLTETATTEAVSPTPVAQPIQTVTPRQAEPGFMGKVMANLWYLLGGIVALVLGVAYFLFRRHQNAEWDSFEDDNDVFGTDSDGYGPDEYMEEGADFDAGLNADASFDLSSEDEELDFDEPVQAETGDVVAEADIYIAYGKLDQAEEMLRRAIADEPDNLDARLKLLEVYVETSDIQAFDEEYQAVINRGDARDSSRAAELRAGIPSAPPFAGDLNAGDAPLDGETQQINEVSTQTEAAQQADTDPGFGDLSLDLDDMADWSVDEESATARTEQVEPLDFELDLSDESSGESDDEVSFDFELDADTALEVGTDGRKSEDILSDLELSLDLDEDAQSLETEVDSATEGEKSLEDFSFELDLDLGDTSSSGSNEDAGLDFALATDELEQDGSILDDAPLTLDALAESELTSDFQLEEETSSDVNKAGAEQEPLLNLEGVDSDAGKTDAFTLLDEDAGNSDDDFAMELGDLDLEALDLEMDALVGSVDDDDVAMAEPLVLAEENAEISAVEPESDALKIDLQLDNLSAEQAAELAHDNPFGEDQDFESDDLEGELDFLADSDEVATKLDLARAYIDMGDQDGARDILDEVTTEGNDEQKREAQELLEKIV